MIITSLRLHDFRCHQEITLNPGPADNWITGANGIGKTSLIEAIYLISRLRSFRTPHLRELCRQSTRAFKVDLHSESESFSYTWKNSQRYLEFNNQPTRNPGEFWGKLPTVLFAPEDQEIVRGPGALRRSWIDSLLAQQHPTYLNLAQRYQRHLKQRNAWLKDKNRKHDLFESLTQPLELLGREITKYRHEITTILQQSLVEVSRELLFSSPLEINYHPSLPNPSTAVDWQSLSDREEKIGTTLIGPHRDNWSLLRNKTCLATYGSQGQQRIAALALRLAETRLLREWRGFWPILLIDDVATPLDADRRTAFEKALPSAAQSFITQPWKQSDESHPETRIWSLDSYDTSH